MTISDLYFEPNHYVAFVLDPASKAHLLKVCPPSFPIIVCHHITIMYNPSEEDFNKFRKTFEKKDPSVTATGILIGDGIEAISAEIDHVSTRKYFGDGYYHVTLSREKKVRPVESNKLFDAKDIKKISFHAPIKLTGEFVTIKS
jgi:hypothetical protein